MYNVDVCVRVSSLPPLQNMLLFPCQKLTWATRIEWRGNRGGRLRSEMKGEIFLCLSLENTHQSVPVSGQKDNCTTCTKSQLKGNKGSDNGHGQWHSPFYPLYLSLYLGVTRYGRVEKQKSRKASKAKYPSVQVAPSTELANCHPLFDWHRTQGYLALHWVLATFLPRTLYPLPCTLYFFSGIVKYFLSRDGLTDGRQESGCTGTWSIHFSCLVKVLSLPLNPVQGDKCTYQTRHICVLTKLKRTTYNVHRGTMYTVYNVQSLCTR